jgi:hypothetical protein
MEIYSTWNTPAFNFLDLKHILFAPFEKSMLEKMKQYFREK